MTPIAASTELANLLASDVRWGVQWGMGRKLKEAEMATEGAEGDELRLVKPATHPKQIVANLPRVQITRATAAHLDDMRGDR